MNCFLPQQRVMSILDIDLPGLWKAGKRGIILDLDNTVTPWHKDKITNDAKKFIENATRLNFKLCLVTNASQGRARRVAEKVGIPFVAPALKPWKRPFLKAAKSLGLAPAEVIVIGDQIFTDILGGNRFGAYTILVMPLGRKEFVGTKIMRFLEKFIERGK